MLGYIIFIIALLSSSLIKNKDKRLLYLFFVITIFSSIRYGIAYDYYMYLEAAIGNRPIDHTELVPRLMLEVSRQTIPFLFFLLSSLFISIFYYFAIKKGGKDHLEEVLFYVAFPFLFFDQLGIIRQGMATAVVFLAIVIEDNKIVQRILLIALAGLCHQSAFVALLILLPWKLLKRDVLWMLFIGSFILGPVIVTLTGSIIGTGFGGEAFSEKASNYLQGSSDVEGNIMKYFMYFIVFVILCNYNKLVKINKTNAYYISLIVLGIALFSIFSFHISIGKRMCMLFFTPTIFIIPQLFKVLKISRPIYMTFSLLLFAMTIYIGSSTVRNEDPPGYSVTYPYRTIFDFIS